MSTPEDDTAAVAIEAGPLTDDDQGACACVIHHSILTDMECHTDDTGTRNEDVESSDDGFPLMLEHPKAGKMSRTQRRRRKVTLVNAAFPCIFVSFASKVHLLCE